MCTYQPQPYQYISLLLAFLLITQSIRNNTSVSFDNHISTVEVHEFVSTNSSRSVRINSLVYTINDLLHITNFSETFQQFELNSSNNSIHLITQWYHETNLRRREELILALHMNLINNAVTKIHFIQNSNHCTVFNDIKSNEYFPYDLLKSKLIIYYDKYNSEEQRLTITRALNYANRFITTGYTVLLNQDTFFDQSILILKHQPLLDERTILYLSRYEVDPLITNRGLQCSDEHYLGNHDALIFQTPFSNNFTEKFPFKIGTENIEIKIIYELMMENYTVRNPCKSIRIWHIRSSQIRHSLKPSTKNISRKLRKRTLRHPEFL